MKVVTECISAGAAKAAKLEGMRVVENTSAALLASWTLRKLIMMTEHDESSATWDRLKNDLVAISNKSQINRLFTFISEMLKNEPLGLKFGEGLSASSPG